MITTLGARMLNRAIRMGSQGMHTEEPEERNACEIEHEAGRLALKGGARSSGYFQFWTVTAAGRRSVHS